MIRHPSLSAYRIGPQWNIVALCGLSEAQSGENAEAISHLSRAFNQVSEHRLRTSTGTQLFSLLMEAGNLNRAAEVVEKLQELDLKSADVVYAAHQVHSLLANQAFQSLAQRAPSSARMYELQGDEMAQVGNIHGATTAYRQAIALNAHLSGIHFALGEALSASHLPAEQAEAKGEYQKALADNPNDERAECRLGTIEFKNSQVKSAILHFQRAVGLQPGDSEANEGLGIVLTGSGDLVGAIASLTRAVQIDPSDESAHLSLGSCR